MGTLIAVARGALVMVAAAAEVGDCGIVTAAIDAAAGELLQCSQMLWP